MAKGKSYRVLRIMREMMWKVGCDQGCHVADIQWAAIRVGLAHVSMKEPVTFLSLNLTE